MNEQFFEYKENINKKEGFTLYNGNKKISFILT